MLNFLLNDYLFLLFFHFPPTKRGQFEATANITIEGTNYARGTKEAVFPSASAESPCSAAATAIK